MTDPAQCVAAKPLYDHQLETVRRAGQQLFDMSDPGTGKTLPELEEFARRRAKNDGPMLVLAPKSILQPAWAQDIKNFYPSLTYSVAYAHNREKAFKVPADVYLTNHDAATWLVKNQRWLPKFSTCALDESTAFKNPSAERSKAVKKFVRDIEYRRCMSGTPNPNTILELWHQMYLLDEGERLGDSYWAFRSSVCEPVQTGPGVNHLEWVDKDGVQSVVYDLIKDICVRHKFEDCISIPERTVTYYDIELPPRLQRAYDEMKRHRMLELGDGAVLAPQASAVLQKLLQIASGSLYAGDKTEILDDGRAELVMDLIEAREQCLVAFIWKHQRDALIEAARKRGFTYGVIDGDETNNNARAEIVRRYQAGEIRVIFAHPKSASHGLTLTAGNTTIWTSPTWSLEAWEQFNRRQYRNGQTKKTQIIMIRAKASVEERVYTALERKQNAMDIFRELVEEAA